MAEPSSPSMFMNGASASSRVSQAPETEAGVDDAEPAACEPDGVDPPGVPGAQPASSKVAAAARAQRRVRWSSCLMGIPSSVDNMVIVP